MPSLDLALISGRVRTLDPARPTATAVGIAGDRIAAVGTDEEIRALVGQDTRVVELAGAAVVPGLIDSHMHPFWGAGLARGVDLMRASTLAEVRRLVAEERARVGPGAWVLGFGLDYNAFAGEALRGDLIADAAGDGPAFLLFVDLHTGLASPLALAAAGIDGPVEFTEHAEVVCDAEGRPTGELREFVACDLVRDAMPQLTESERYDLYASTLRRLAAAGLTGTHAMDGDLRTLDLLRELESRGDLVTRIVAPFLIAPDSTDEQWAAFAEQVGARGERWRGGVAKFFIDGVIDAGTAWLCDADTQGESTAPFWPDPARYREAVQYFASRGFQCVTHACGDRAVREALDAYRAAGPSLGAPHRVEHIETIQPVDLPRFAADGVTASMQTQHMMGFAADGTDNWSSRVGPARRATAFPTRTLWESGALVALGSDWPVARFDWREGLASARLRLNPWHPERAPYDDQALTALQALEGYTVNAARTAGDADRLGAVRPGLLADLTVLGRDPVDCPAEELLQVEARLTIVGGEIVFGP